MNNSNDEHLEHLAGMADLTAIDDRKNDPVVPFEQVVKELGFSLDDIRRQAKEKSAKRTRKTRP